MKHEESMDSGEKEKGSSAANVCSSSANYDRTGASNSSSSAGAAATAVLSTNSTMSAAGAALKLSESPASSNKDTNAAPTGSCKLGPNHDSDAPRRLGLDHPVEPVSQLSLRGERLRSLGDQGLPEPMEGRPRRRRRSGVRRVRLLDHRGW